MKLIYGDLFDQHSADAICITTNGFVKKNGRAVMGKGCASRAKEKWSGIDKELGTNIITIGNVPAPLHETKNYNVLSFPVKPKYIFCNKDKSNVVTHMRKRFNSGEKVPGWAAIANVKIIERSARKLIQLTNMLDYKNIILPRPGCGAGELNWLEVYDIISPILDDRFKVITFRK